jgi:two-component system, cell cycle sensor histidine kinase and response regulator CckA
MEKENVVVTKGHVAPLGKTILLAEDDSLVRELVQEYLKGHGYKLIVAESGQAALDASANYAGHIDLLLSDFQMPNMDGLRLAEQIIALRPRTKALLMSGYTSDAARLSSSAKSNTAFIQKPFMPPDLLDRIERLIA